MVTAGKLTYYKEQNLKEQKGEVRVTIHSKIESVADHTKSFRKLRSVFRLTNAPYLEIEMSAGDEKVTTAVLNVFTHVCLSRKGGLPSHNAMGRPPYIGRQSTSGRYASYWNASLLNM